MNLLQNLKMPEGKLISHALYSKSTIPEEDYSIVVVSFKESVELNVYLLYMDYHIGLFMFK